MFGQAATDWYFTAYSSDVNILIKAASNSNRPEQKRPEIPNYMHTIPVYLILLFIQIKKGELRDPKRIKKDLRVRRDRT